MTQEEVAYRAGISREYLSIVENNKKSPTIDTLSMICKSLNVRVSKVIKRVEDSGKWN